MIDNSSLSISQDAPDTKQPKGRGAYDPFQAFLCEGAEFTPQYDLIRLHSTDYVPERVITFSKAINRKTDDVEATVSFYEDDAKFWSFVRNPEKYLPILRRHPAVIMPDISTNFDLPAPIKWNNVFRNYALAYWMQKNGMVVIPNARPVIPFPLKATLGGMPQKSVIAIGAHGNMKQIRNRLRFKKGVKEVVDYLNPTFLVVYGNDSYDLFDYPKRLDVPLRFYPSHTSMAHATERRLGNE